MKNSL